MDIDVGGRKELTEKLIQIVGKFEDVKHRQDVFRIMDKINGVYGDVDSLSISSGSLSEGLDIQGSDEDLTFILKYVTVVPSFASYVGFKDETVVLAEFEKNYPGYAKICPLLDSSASSYMQNAAVVSSMQFRDQFLGSGQETHGPCTTDGERDFALCIRCPFLPDSVIERFSNRKSKWLKDDFLREILPDGCLMVPIGPRSSEKRNILWRISFSLAEKELMLKMNYAQILCYALLKIFLKEVIEHEENCKELLCSYFLKTCLFWLIEETDNDAQVWNVDNLWNCFALCLNKLKTWVASGNCPNYFIPENNMFSGRVLDETQKDILLQLITKINSEGCSALLRCESFCLQSEVLTDAQREANLDFLCFRAVHIYPFDDINSAYMAARDLENMLLTTKMDGFAQGVITKLRSSVHQEIAQMLPIPKVTGTSQDSSCNQHIDHILLGGESDVLSGPLLRSCFHYNLGHYNKALEILEQAETKLKPSLIPLRKEIYSPDEYKLYVETMCGKGLTLSHKMKHATVSVIIMLDNSSLIPEEFIPEIQYRPLCSIPASVLMYSIKYLCFHKLQDISGRKESLTQLEDVVKNKFLILSRDYSLALTLLGACVEIEGDAEGAQRHYELALKHLPICKSAQDRINRIKSIST